MHDEIFKKIDRFRGYVRFFRKESTIKKREEVSICLDSQNY